VYALKRTARSYIFTKVSQQKRDIRRVRKGLTLNERN